MTEFKIKSTGKLKPAPQEEVDLNELEIGIKVEKEHTDDPKVAETIARQHLAEIPDYYTRLNKMETEALKKSKWTIGRWIKSQLGLFEPEEHATGETKDNLVLMPSKSNPNIRRWQEKNKEEPKPEDKTKNIASHTPKKYMPNQSKYGIRLNNVGELSEFVTKKHNDITHIEVYDDKSRVMGGTGISIYYTLPNKEEYRRSFYVQHPEGLIEDIQKYIDEAKHESTQSLQKQSGENSEMVIAKKLNDEITVAAKRTTQSGEKIDHAIARTKDWISSVLKNDESSSYKGLVEYFQQEGKFSKDVAEFIVSKRDKVRDLPFGLRTELNDEDGKKIGKKKTSEIKANDKTPQLTGNYLYDIYQFVDAEIKKGSNPTEAIGNAYNKWQGAQITSGRTGKIQKMNMSEFGDTYYQQKQKVDAVKLADERKQHAITQSIMNPPSRKDLLENERATKEGTLRLMTQQYGGNIPEKIRKREIEPLMDEIEELKREIKQHEHEPQATKEQKHEKEITGKKSTGNHYADWIIKRIKEESNGNENEEQALRNLYEDTMKERNNELKATNALVDILAAQKKYKNKPYSAIQEEYESEKNPKQEHEIDHKDFTKIAAPLVDFETELMQTLKDDAKQYTKEPLDNLDAILRNAKSDKGRYAAKLRIKINRAIGDLEYNWKAKLPKEELEKHVKRYTDEWRAFQQSEAKRLGHRHPAVFNFDQIWKRFEKNQDQPAENEKSSSSKHDYSNWTDYKQLKVTIGGSHRERARQEGELERKGIPFKDGGRASSGSHSSKRTLIVPLTQEAKDAIKEIGGKIDKEQWEHLTEGYKDYDGEVASNLFKSRNRLFTFFGKLFKSQLGLFSDTEALADEGTIKTEHATGESRDNLMLMPSKSNPRVRRWQDTTAELPKQETLDEAYIPNMPYREEPYTTKEINDWRVKHGKEPIKDKPLIPIKKDGTFPKEEVIKEFPESKNRPEKMRVIKEGAQHLVQTYSEKQGKWITQAEHTGETEAIRDAEQWYPEQDDINTELNDILKQEKIGEVGKGSEAYEKIPDIFSQPAPEPEKVENDTEEKKETREIVTGRKARQRANEEAIALLQSKSDDQMTSEDKAILSRYSGDGGTDEVSLNEFYTHPMVTSFMWDMMRKLGFKGGHILEPSCATGAFINTKPDGTLITGVEISPVSARIARILNPNDDIVNSSYEEFAKEYFNETFDGIVGNIPFGVRGASRGDHRPDISTFEEYFMEELPNALNEGAIISMIVPTGVMNNSTLRETRKSMCEKGQFLAAFRMPNKAFRHTGTSVTTDIIFLKRHPDSVVDAIMQDKDAVKNGATPNPNMEKLYHKSFVDGNYFQNEGKGNIWGEEAVGQWGSMVVKGELQTEYFDKALAGEYPAMDYTGIADATIDERELHVGDTKFIRGREYRLNENHRWERVDTTQEEIARRMNVDFEKWGVGNRDEFHQSLKDVSRLSKLTAEERKTAKEYLEVVSSSDFEGVEKAQMRIDAALKAAEKSSTPEEADKFYAASIIGAFIRDLQEQVNNGQLPDHSKFTQMILLLDEYKEKYGNPYNDNKLKRQAIFNKDMARLLGAYKPDGDYSDFMRKPEEFLPSMENTTSEYDPNNLESVVKHFERKGIESNVPTIARYYEDAKGKSDDELEALLLSDENIGFDKGKYVPLEQVLTGSVYDKLDRWQKEIQALETSDEAHKEMKANKLKKQIEQLESRSHKRIVEEMPIFFSANWLPLDYLNEFLKSEEWKEIKYDSDRRTYEVDYSTDGEEPNKYNMYGDLIRYINNQSLEHGSQNKDRMAALKDFELKFKGYLATHPDRAKIEDIYNRKYNNYIEENFDNTPLNIEKLSKDFSLNAYHNSAIRRLIAKGKGILAFGTGLGKTMSGIGLALYKKQIGEWKKPMIVVPKSVLSQWVSEIKRFTGENEVKILVIGEKEALDKNGYPKLDADGRAIMRDETAEEVQAKLQHLAQNEYDLVLVSDTKLDTMTLSENYLKDYMDDIVDRHVFKSNADMSDKDREKAIARLMGRVGGRLSGTDREQQTKEGKKGGTFKAKAINFDELGVDGLIVDEAHNYKNLFGVINNRVRGVMSEQDTQQSMRMYLFSKYINQKHDNKNMYLMTATPTPNNPLEIFNMFQYFAPEEMDKRGIYNIEQFLQIFGEVKPVKTQKADGSMVDQETLVGFKNLPELRQAVFEYTDMRNAKDVGLKVPEEKAMHVVSVMSPLQQKVFKQLRTRAEEWLKMDKEQRAESGENILTIIGNMVKASVSIGLLKDTIPKGYIDISEEELAEDGHSPKMQQCIEDTVDFYKQGKKKLVFARFKALQQELKSALVKSGIPENEIYVFNADTTKTSSLRSKVSDDFNNGKYKIIIGNETMSEGMNFQVDTKGVDNLMLAWTPDELIQRKGRVVRQGNKSKEVEVKYYFTSGTIDSMFHEILSRKTGWQYDLYRSKADKADNPNAQGRQFTPQEIEVLLSDNPEEARRKLDALKAQGAEKQKEELTSRAVSNFSQLQNLIVQRQKMHPYDKKGQRGMELESRIKTVKAMLNKSEYFEHKGLLESDQPSYVDSEKRIVLPVGQMFTDISGDAKKHGLFMLRAVDPVSREVTIQKVTKHGGSWRLGHRAGEMKNIDYKEFRESFPNGMKAMNSTPKEINEIVYENLEDVSSIASLTPEFISNNKQAVLSKIIEGKIPRLDKSTGKLKLVDISTFAIDEDTKKYADEEKAKGETGYWTEQLEKQEKNLKPIEEAYLPIDPIRWRNDILNHALDERDENAERHKRYGSYHSYGRNRNRRSSSPDVGEWEQYAKDLYGYHIMNMLPEDFKRTKVQTSNTEDEE